MDATTPNQQTPNIVYMDLTVPCEVNLIVSSITFANGRPTQEPAAVGGGNLGVNPIIAADKNIV